MKLRDLLETEKYLPAKLGESGAEVYHLPGLKAYLKMGRIGGLSDLDREGRVLRWLEGKLDVPKVLEYESDGNDEALLISEIAGRPASNIVSGAGATREEISTFVAQAARTMRTLHSIPADGCPFDQGLDAKFANAWENIRSGLVDVDDFDEECASKTPEQIFQELCDERPEDEDPVFTHGDLCLPNIIVGFGGEIAGFVDIGRGGVCDRYQDIALFIHSFEFNAAVKIDIESEFCEAYGIEAPDKRKMSFYRKMDELF